MTYFTYFIITGWVSGFLMFTLFLYAAKKHLKQFRNIGTGRQWFRIHVIIGLLTPIAVLFHTKVHLGSINGMTAVFAMSVVVLSGIVGRFLLRRAIKYGSEWLTWYARWHILHVPLLYLLAISVIAHIIAVHAY